MVINGYEECHTRTNGNTKTKIIIRFATRVVVFNLAPQTLAQQSSDNNYASYIRQQIEIFITQKWGLNSADYYLDLQIPSSLNETFIVVHTKKQCDTLGGTSGPPCTTVIAEIRPRIRGGSVKSAFMSFLKATIDAFVYIFKPIAKPLVGIANAFLMLVKAIIYMIMLLMWFMKFIVWIITEVLPSIPTDIFGMIRFLAATLIDGVVGTAMYYCRKLFNAAGSTVIGAALSGWDNNPETDNNGQPKQSVVEFEDSKQQEKTDTNHCQGRKCYKTEDGTVPWTVILATVLFPPAGVFMELGLHGWIQILVCLLLTFMFYFPGLIYALILLYC